MKARFRSKRDIPLITQEVEDKPMLTVENYLKWYDLYVISTDGVVTPVRQLENDEVEQELYSGWLDHCIRPKSFHKIAEILGARYDYATWESVERRFQTEYLDN